MEQRGRRLTDAFVAALELRKRLREGTDFCTALADLRLKSRCSKTGIRMAPRVVPIPRDAQALCLSGNHWRQLSVSHAIQNLPTHSVSTKFLTSQLSLERGAIAFDDDVRGYVTASAHCLVKEIHNENLAVPEVRPLEEVKQSSEETTDSSENATEFSDEEIYRTTRLAREHGFGPFDSARAQNATYEDTRFFELQTFIGMVGCGTPQGAARFKFRRGKEYGPHGDTHLRAVKQFDPERLLDGFQQTTGRLLSVIQSESSFRRPVTVAIDITTIRYFGNVEECRWLAGRRTAKGEHQVRHALDCRVEHPADSRCRTCP